MNTDNLKSYYQSNIFGKSDAKKAIKYHLFLLFYRLIFY